MLRRMCQQQRLLVRLEGDTEFQAKDERGDSVSSILLAGSHISEERLTSSTRISDTTAKRRYSKLDRTVYDAILAYLATRGEHLQHRQVSEYRPGIEVLTQQAQAVDHIEIHARRFGRKDQHEGNSLVWFHTGPNAQSMGFIEAMWRLIIADEPRIFLVIQELEGVPEEQDPFSEFPGFGCRVAYSHDSGRRGIIEAKALISHLAALRRPAGTFGIDSEVIVLCNLNQGRVQE